MIQCLLLFILLTEQRGKRHGVSILPGSVSACFCIDLHVAETALFSLSSSLHKESTLPDTKSRHTQQEICPPFSFYTDVSGVPKTLWLADTSH